MTEKKGVFFGLVKDWGKKGSKLQYGRRQYILDEVTNWLTMGKFTDADKTAVMIAMSQADENTRRFIEEEIDPSQKGVEEGGGNVASRGRRIQHSTPRDNSQ